MQINSTLLGSSARLAIEAAEMQAEQAQLVSNDTPQASPNQGRLSIASFVPTDGLHPIAGGQATTTAAFAGGNAVGEVIKAIGDALNSVVDGPKGDGPVRIKGALGGRCTRDHD